MAAPTITALESPSLPRHITGTELGMEIFNVTTDGSPSDTSFTTKIIQQVFAVIGVDSPSISGNTISLTGAKLPTSTNFTILVLGKGGA